MSTSQTHSTFGVTLVIDDVPIGVRIKRMTNTEFDAFAAGFDRWVRSPRGPEETVEKRRTREQASAAWLRQALDDYLTILPGEIAHDDGREITRGGELLEVYAARLNAVVPQAVSLVYGQNQVSEKEKADLQAAARFGVWLEERAPADGRWKRSGLNCEKCRREQLDIDRGCDGTPQRRVVWHDGPVRLKTCPVRAFTPEVESALRWFHWTHALTLIPMVGARYERVSWPTAGGGAGEQDAWLTQALVYLRSVHNAMLREAGERAPQEQAVKRTRDARRRISRA